MNRAVPTDALVAHSKISQATADMLITLSNWKGMPLDLATLLAGQAKDLLKSEILLLKATREIPEAPPISRIPTFSHN